jgi:hypothetical protein
MAHLYRHAADADAEHELAAATLHEHFRWSPARMQRVLLRLRARRWVQVVNGAALLTPQGKQQVEAFRDQHLLKPL